jgi:hypothetical protein
MRVVNYKESIARAVIYYENYDVIAVALPRYIADILNEIKSTGKASNTGEIPNTIIEVDYYNDWVNKDLKQRYIIVGNIIIHLKQRSVVSYYYYSDMKTHEAFFIHSIYLINKDVMNKLSVLGKDDFTEKELKHLAITQSTEVYRDANNRI